MEPAEAALVENEAVGNYFEDQLEGEDGGEEIVEVV